jgi:hypothetical protein
MSIYKEHQPLEIFTGNLLTRRKAWQSMKCQLPTHTYLLVTTLDNQTQTRFMHSLGRSLRAEGLSVVVLSVFFDAQHEGLMTS